MSHNSLSGSEAISKIKDLAMSIDFAMLATNLDERPFHAVPMSTKLVDDQGCIWFLSGKNSDHNRHIASDGKAHLVYSSPDSMQFMNVFGNATIHTDNSRLERLYDPTDDMWFEGVDDPNLTAICVEPCDANYWDTKSNQIVTVFKLGAAMIQGENPNVTVSGKLTP